MSKIELVNAYKRTTENEIRKDNYFFERFLSLNKRNLINRSLNFNEETNEYLYEGYGELLILPDGYFPVTSDYVDNVYISDSSDVLYKLVYYPGLEKENEEEMDTTSVITKISKQKIYLEREYILERSSFLTEEKYGENNPNQLLCALENIESGNYTSFTNKEHAREDLRQVPPEEINQLTRQILYKYDLINKNSYINDSDVRELFVTFIKEKVRKEKMDRVKNNVLSLTDLLTNMD